MSSRDDSVQQAAASAALPPSLTVRAWQAADFPRIRDLAADEGWTTLTERPHDGLRAWQGSWPALVAVHQGECVGFLRALTDGAVTVYIADLLVVPAWRRQGVGAALLEVCHQLFPSARLDLLATEQGTAFYEALGFRTFRGFRSSYQ